MPGKRTRIALTPLPLVLLCAAEGIVCAYVAFLSTSYAHTGRQGIKRSCYVDSCVHDSNIIAVIIDLKSHIFNYYT